MGSGANPRSWGIFLRIFVSKVTLQAVRLLLTVSYRKKFGQQDVLVAPPVICWLLHRFRRLCSEGDSKCIV